MEKREYQEIAVFIGTTAAVYLAIKYLLPLVAPFLFSWLIAWALLPAVTFLKKKLHIAKGIGGTILIGVLVLCLGMAVLEIAKLGLSQMGRLVQNFPIYSRLVESQAEKICCYCDNFFHLQDGVAMGFVENGMANASAMVQTKMLPELSKQTVFGVGKVFSALWILFLVFLGAFLIVKDSEDLKIIWEESLWYQKGQNVLEKLSQTGLAYGKAQLVIMALTLLVCSAGLFLIGNPYSLLLGAVIAVLDAFPAVGSGIILVPWGIFKVINGELMQGAALLTVYVICQIIRQMVESKLIGDRTGIKPIFTIIAMYAGLQLFGVFGFILGPVALVAIKASLQSLW